METHNTLASIRVSGNEPTPWVSADRLDPQRADLKTLPQLYNLDCVAYESLLLGLFSILGSKLRLSLKTLNLLCGVSLSSWCLCVCSSASASQQPRIEALVQFREIEVLPLDRARSVLQVPTPSSESIVRSSDLEGYQGDY